MLVVSNTSPLSNLAVVNRLDLLREQFGAVTIPPAVKAELERHPNPSARGRALAAILQKWACVRELSRPVPVELVLALDTGGSEAIALAMEIQADIVLLDESDARKKAKELGIRHTGVLGVLKKAKDAGRITSLRAEIHRLREEAGFFVYPTLEKELLKSVNEA